MRFDLPFKIPERVIVDHTFATRDLVFALNRSPRYRVLVLSDRSTRLFLAVRDALTEVNLGGFPLAMEGPGADEPLPGGRGVEPSTYRDDMHRKFSRRVDEALASVSSSDPLPLVVAGVERSLAFLREISRAVPPVAELRGSHEKDTPHELGLAVWPLVERSLAQRRAATALAAIDSAIKSKRLATGMTECWHAAYEGRGALLLVEEGLHYPARLGPSPGLLVPVDDPKAPGAMDDAVDELVESVLLKGGEVVFVADGALAAQGRVALSLRY